MIRKLLSSSKHEPLLNRPKRNYEVQRIETFSDAVFGFAVTLLIVSLEVPKNFDELLITMRGFFAFGISFVLLIFIWNEQHNFFRRYGLDDTVTLSLNLALLFIVLFFVYPLKFLFTLMFHAQIYGDKESFTGITLPQATALMKIYALGYIAIYLLFVFMYLRVLAKSEELKLDQVEIFEYRTTIYKQLLLLGVGLASLMLAMTVPANYFWLSGVIYTIIGPAITILYTVRARKKVKRFPAKTEHAEA